MHRLAGLALAATVLAACGDDADPVRPAVACADNLTAVTTTVTQSGDDVRFDWTPRCPVAMVLVEGVNGDAWRLWAPDSLWEGPEANLIVPPVTYGESRTGMVGQPAEALVVGERYDLVLWRVTPPGTRMSGCAAFIENNCIVGLRRFTR